MEKLILGLLKNIKNFIEEFLWEKENIDLIDFNSAAKIKIKNNWIISFYKYRQKNIRDAIWQIKYRRNLHFLKVFSEKIALFLLEKNKSGENYILVPIPIHWRRRLERGFNQSEILTKFILKNLKELKVTNFEIKNILMRKTYSKKQSWQNKKERVENIKNVFSLRKKYLYLEKEKIKGRIIIIDDVVTTGATLNEAKIILQKISAGKIWAITIAY
jgi:competence protein ComFC